MLLLVLFDNSEGFNFIKEYYQKAKYIDKIKILKLFYLTITKIDQIGQTCENFDRGEVNSFSFIETPFSKPCWIDLNEKCMKVYKSVKSMLIIF